MKQRIGVLVFFFLCSSLISQAQTPTAVVNGQVRDTSGAAIPDARVEVINDATNVRYTTETNDEGIYSVPNVPPGTYHFRVSKQGFKTIVHPDITLNVQDAKAIGFTLPVGPISDTVTVEGGALLINAESAAVSTVVDRRFVENMPLNGRSFQTLISLTPGVVATPTSFNEEGQFSVNGQRADANYFMVDGVSANIGISAGSGLVQSLGGSLPGFSTLGSTNTLVSVDAMQKFRIQTSTFAPEFGRSPGAQVSIITRSGTNQFHGTLFEYLRNDVLDARNWFVNHNGLPKPKERQNDFGGVFGGPILKNRTFLFFSYEGLRLRQPSFQTTFVPDAVARQMASAAVNPLLAAFPVPNAPDVAANVAPFSSSFSNPASLDAYSTRIDQVIGSRFSLFGRYDYAPSELVQRGIGGSLSVLQHAPSTTHTLTLGLTANASTRIANEFRANYSNVKAGTVFSEDNFGGAVPLTTSALQVPAGYTAADSLFAISFLSVNGLGQLFLGKSAVNEQRQLNFVDNVSWMIRTHQIKWGIDYRWLAPISGPFAYDQSVRFSGLSGPNGAVGGNARTLIIAAQAPTSFISRNVSLFGQDTWKLNRRLTLTYGLRWDVNPAPEGKNAQSTPLALQNVNSTTALAPAPLGSPLYATSLSNIAPRLGIAYQIFDRASWASVIRGGAGIFYDSSSGSLGALSTGAPFQGLKVLSNIPYPLTPAQVAAPAISTSAPFSASVTGADPDLSTPRTYQWNVTLEQEVGSHQSFSLAYVGAVGRDLLRQDTLSGPNSNFLSTVFISRSNATSDYHAMQAKFQKQLSHGLQALASYTWSHSIDIASNDSSATNTPPTIGIQLDRGNSDFDVRHSMSAAISYDVPTPKIGRVGTALLGGWSVDNLITARSATPVTVLGNAFQTVSGLQFAARPNIVPGAPFYLFGSQFPGGKAFNRAAFTSTVGATQGNLPRNLLRGFGAAQDDFTIRRQFHLTERASMQFRAEFFNVFNHPNFGNPVATLTSPNFGQSSQTLATALSPGGIGAGLSPLYQVGGPRSIQFALKLSF